jgi:tRNA A37 methylthiotransferase MiaB
LKSSFGRVCNNDLFVTEISLGEYFSRMLQNLQKEEESTVDNRKAIEDILLTAAGCFHFCTYCHWMLPMNRDGLTVSH